MGNQWRLIREILMGKISNEYASTEGKLTLGRARGAQRVIGILLKSDDKRLCLLITGKEQRTTGVPFYCLLTGNEQETIGILMGNIETLLYRLLRPLNAGAF